MLSKSGLDEILDFAITGEEAAYRFYTEWAGKMKNEAMRQALLEFAAQEKGHKAKLEVMKNGNVAIGAQSEPGKMEDLKIADYMVRMEPREDMDYQEALMLAMRREMAAFRLYSDLADTIGDPDKIEVFLALAREEAAHKLRFEIEYDEEILKEN